MRIATISLYLSILTMLSYVNAYGQFEWKPVAPHKDKVPAILIATDSAQLYQQPNSDLVSAYRPFIEENKHWIFQSHFDIDLGGIYRGFILNIQGDTLVNNQVYSKVIYSALLGEHLCPNPPCFEPFFPYELGMQSLFALIREDTVEQKVYHLNHDANFLKCEIEEYVLFDFSLTKGDSLHSCINEAIGTSQSSYSIVDSITLEYVYGEEREVINTTGSTPIVGLQFPDKLKILEGIGFETYGLFPGTLDQLVEVCYGALQECNILSSTTEFAKPEFVILPNPSNGKFEIQTTAFIHSVAIYNLSGMELAYFEKSQVDISYMDSGLYLFQITFSNGSSIIEKVIKV